MIPSAPIARSELDSQGFGMEIARGFIRRPEEIEQAIAECRSQNIQVIFVRTPSDCAEAIAAIGRLGGECMDRLVYYGRRLNTPMAQPAGTIRPLEERDIGQVVAITDTAFRDYDGHYHNDPRLPRDKSHHAYVDWALRACHARDAQHEVMVAVDERDDTKIAGFLTMAMNSPQEAEYILSGIDEAYRGQGVYGALIAAGLHWAKRQGAQHSITSTQTTNAAVQKAWQRLGFELWYSYETFHLWLDRIPERAG